jgi:hypothetical protein
MNHAFVIGEISFWLAYGAGIGLLLLAAGTIWGLHRICLSLEEHGFIYYLNRPASGTISSSMLELERFMEPTKVYVHEMREDAVTKADQLHSGE